MCCTLLLPRGQGARLHICSRAIRYLNAFYHASMAFLRGVHKTLLCITRCDRLIHMCINCELTTGNLFLHAPSCSIGDKGSDSNSTAFRYVHVETMTQRHDSLRSTFSACSTAEMLSHTHSLPRPCHTERGWQGVVQWHSVSSNEVRSLLGARQNV